MAVSHRFHTKTVPATLYLERLTRIRQYRFVNQRIYMHRLFLGNTSFPHRCGLCVTLSLEIREFLEAKDNVLVEASHLICRSLLQSLALIRIVYPSSRKS
jgi:hypothetical protein